MKSQEGNMRKRLIVLGVLFLLGVIAITGMRWKSQACLREMAACEAELTAIAGKLRTYAEAHQGMFPETDAELTKALGKPLPSHLMYWGYGFALIPPTTDYGSHDPIIVDKNRHFPWPSRLEEFFIPNSRVQMLLNDLSIYHAQDWKAFT
jgi:hypothetical protein